MWSVNMSRVPDDSMMILGTLDTLGPRHGYEVQLNQGIIYASLVRVLQRGRIGKPWAL
jgi:hypothetical protein